MKQEHVVVQENDKYDTTSNSVNLFEENRIVRLNASFGTCFRVSVVITTVQRHSTKPELRFCAGSNPARGDSDGEDL